MYSSINDIKFKTRILKCHASMHDETFAPINFLDCSDQLIILLPDHVR